jgi:hypothetical protein
MILIHRRQDRARLERRSKEREIEEGEGIREEGQEEREKK